MRPIIGPLIVIASVLGLACPAVADDLASTIAKLQAAGPDSQGQREAQPAWRQAAASDVSQVPVLLAGLDKANPIAANWIRTAIDAVKKGDAVVLQVERHGSLRYVAFVVE